MKLGVSAYSYARLFGKNGFDIYKLIKTAKETGLDVIGHIPVAVGAQMAINQGQYCFEHMKALKREFLEPAARAGIYFTPTLVTQKLIWMIKNDRITEDMYSGGILKYVNPSVIERWRETVAFYKIHDFKLDRSFEEYIADVKVFLDHGGKLLAGTDAQNPFIVFGFSLHDELEILAQSGISCYEVLKSATISGAESNHQADQWGTIEPGKYANMTILDANPLYDISNTRKISSVVLKGQYYDKDTLNGFLDDVAKHCGNY